MRTKAIITLVLAVMTTTSMEAQTYGDEGPTLTPNAPGTYLKSSLMDMKAWDATDHADLIDQPLLVMAGSKTDSCYMTEEAFAKATGTVDKELFIVPGATHIKTYYVPEYVNAITAKVSEFFKEKLR